MEPFSPEHLAVLAGTAAAAVGAALLARRDPAGRITRPLLRVLAAVLVLNEIAFRVWEGAEGRLSVRTDLPLQLTDVAAVVAAVALWTGAPLAFELTWFWAMTATVQALLTPDLHHGFPDPRWWWFVIEHSGVVVAAVALAWGLRRTPRPGAVRRVFGWSLVVAAAAALGSRLSGGDYMYLRRKPPESTLLDVMGPWPWYIASAAALALVLFWLLDRPFDGRRRAAKD